MTYIKKNSDFMLSCRASRGSCVKRFKAIWAFFALIFIFSLQPVHLKAKEPTKDDYNTYYKAVIVLKSLDRNSQEEPEYIPRGLSWTDEVESVLHHPDSRYVLRSVANDLAGLSDSFPKARLFESYARLALGDVKTASKLMVDYLGAVATSEPRHYEILTENLLTQEDWLSLYIISLEWAERHPACEEKRISYIWASLRGLKRYKEASKMAQENKKCLGWKWSLYTAIAAFDSGDRSEGEKFLIKTYEDNPNQKAEIDLIWSELMHGR